MEVEEQSRQIKRSANDRYDPVDARSRSETEDKYASRDEQAGHETDFEPNLGMNDFVGHGRPNVPRRDVILLVDAVDHVLHEI